MTKIAINGFGRIGRPALKVILDKHPNLEVVAINDLTDTKTLAHLLKYDSNYGIYEKDVCYDKEHIIIDGKQIKVFAQRDPELLPWKDLEVDVVLECTGFFRDKEGAGKHLKAGAKKVIISAPAKSDGINSFVLGVNEEKYDSQKDDIIMTTIHSYTNDQKILDLPHKDLRRGRAAAMSIIPTTTGAAKAVIKTIPELAGKLDGMAMRVPTPVVSIVDFVATLKKSTSIEEVNNLFKEASENNLKNILAVSKEPLVSMDFKGNRFSSIVDLPLTMVNENLVKVCAWYDNEFGYTCRLVEMAEFVGKG